MGSFGRGKRGGGGGLGGFDRAEKRCVFVVMVGETTAALVGSRPRRRERSGAAAVVPPSGFAREQRAMSNDAHANNK